MPTVTADELYSFICANAEEIDGEIICRASLWEELERRGVPRGPQRQGLRVSLVKELEARGLIRRLHPRSRRLLLINPDPELLPRVKKESRERFQDRMAFDAIEIQAPCSSWDWARVPLREVRTARDPRCCGKNPQQLPISSVDVTGASVKN